ncbi:MAG TPA: GntR family transcriptional regulator [Spirochaetia bacterium]|nr:GntR family transcriptional regulator [Spirochaetia bacterium]HRZ64544.1 GntR family transcriptional regulator [Spirochaetia bacterium]
MPDSSRPLYEQLKQTVIHDIVSGRYKHGERLPSEIALAAAYNISRITVRRAISELVAEGYLSSQQGKGTFVDYIKGENRLLSFGAFSEGATGQSSSKTTRILSKEMVLADEDIAANLRVAPGTELIRLHRLVSEDGTPYSIDTAYFPTERYPGIFDLMQDNVSTFAIMKERYGIVFAKAVKALSVIRAGLAESELLHCVPGDPLFSISKVIYDRGDVPVHYSHYLVVGDRCVYTLTVVDETADMHIHYRGEHPSP